MSKTVPIYKSECKSKDEAKRRAVELVDYISGKLPGSKWKIRVWKNGAWHVCLNCGSIQLYPNYYPRDGVSDSFSVLIGSRPDGTGGAPMNWSSTNSSRSPIASIKKAVALMEEVVTGYHDVMMNNRKKLGIASTLNKEDK